MLITEKSIHDYSNNLHSYFALEMLTFDDVQLMALGEELLDKNLATDDYALHCYSEAVVSASTSVSKCVITTCCMIYLGNLDGIPLLFLLNVQN